MGKIADLKKPVRRLTHYDGQWWIVTLTREGVTMKLYKKRAKATITRLWREVASPATLPLFEGVSHVEGFSPPIILYDDPAPANSGVEHEAGGNVCGLPMPDTE
jgi:hypothetical protein